MKIDRPLQLSILQRLAETYPDPCILNRPDSEAAIYRSNLHYLHEHGLVTEKEYRSENLVKPYCPAITAAGLDFLADDGGLSAILGVVTIKLHDETIRQLIETRIQSAVLPETTKSHLLKSLREAPGETVKLLTEKLLDASLSSWPAAIAVIQKFL